MNSVFDEYYKQYDAWYENHPRVFLSEVEAIKKVLPPHGRGLEIGVGTGRFAAALGIAEGIDPSHAMLEIARTRGVNVRAGIGEDLPYFYGAFDYAAIIITLCFVKNPKKVLKEIYHVLKMNGRIIIGIIDKESFLGRFYQTKKSIFYEQARFLSVPGVTDLLSAAGFDAFSYYQTVFTLPDGMRDVEEPKKGFGTGGFVVISAEKKEHTANIRC